MAAFGAGIGIGNGAARKKVKRQLREALDENEISTHNQRGGTLTINDLPDRRGQNDKQA